MTMISVDMPQAIVLVALIATSGWLLTTFIKRL